MTNPETSLVARLTAPGQPLEIREERVLGLPMEVFAHQERSLVDLLRNSEALGERPYLLGDGFSIGFAEQARLARNGAALLQAEHGIRQGDRVAVYGMNGPEWIIAFWSLAVLGAIVVCGNSMGVGPELQHQIDLTDPRIVLADEMLAARLGDCDLGGRALVDLAGFAARAAAAGDAPWPQVDIAPDDPATIVFTSGTTGRPKGATHSHRNMVGLTWFYRFADALAAARGFPPGRRRFLLASPLFHIAGLHNLAVVRMATGDTAVVHRGKFDIDAVLSLIERHRVTNWGAMPTMLSRLVEADLTGRDLSSLRVLTLNSAPSSPELKAKVRARLPHVASSFGTSYGLTETSSAVTIATAEMLLEEDRVVGTPIPTMHVEVRGPDGRALPDGVEGEIFVYGPLVMLGYWGMGERAGIGADGWFPTADLGWMKEGRLHLSARRTDLIIRGGQNVYPAEVENAILTHPEVRECAVLGVADEEWGQLVRAVVVVDEGSPLTAEELREHLAPLLAKYKTPTLWTITAEPLRRNATGKVMRRLIPAG